MPNVKVVATNQGTKLEHTAETSEEGLYTIPFLPIGSYVVTVEASGFKRLISNPIQLEVNQAARVDLSMEVGEVTQQVTVEDVAPILQTESTTVGQVITGNTTVNLPLNGRNFQQLTLLVPGAITPNPGGFTNPGLGTQGRPFVNGNREQGNSFLLDGISVDETIDNRIGYKPNVDAIAEFRVETSNSSSEFGNVTGAVVNATMKSGTNEFHGNLFEFFRNDALDANTWANKRSGALKQKLRQNIYGGTIGGPILRNKLFFFGAYQGSKQRTGGGTSVTVAPVEWRSGNLSSLTTPIRDPQRTGNCNATDRTACFPGNIIPQNRIINPVARALFADTSLYPLPTRLGTSNITGNYATTFQNTLDAYQFDIKIDGKISDKDNVSGRYSFGNYDTNSPQGALPTNITGTSFSRPQNIALNWNHVFSPAVVNEARVGFNRAVFISDFFDFAGIGDANAELGIPGGQAIPGISSINVGNGITTIGSIGINEDNVTNTFHYGDNLSVSRGRHFMRMGGQWLRYQQNRFYPGNNGLLGLFEYDGRFTGVPFADFLLDQLSRKGIGSRTGTWGHRQNRIGIFFQDDFKARNNLTLNLGMRWEYTSPVYEVKDRQSNFDIATGRQLFAGRDGNSRALYEPFYKGFEPRIGFAWTPGRFDSKLVVRAGYGITQYMEGTGSNLRLPLNPPFFSEADRPFDATTGPGTISTGFTDVIVRNQPFGQIRIWNPDIRPQFTQQWNGTLEYQLTNSISLTTAYVGHKATHLVAPTDWNQPLPGTGPPSTWLPLQQRRPFFSVFPLVTQVSGTDSWARSNYHALQASSRQRFSRGLEFLISYTWSKTMTDNLGYYGSPGVAAQGAYSYNHYNRQVNNYGPAFFDATHNFSWSGTYELPFGRERAWGGDWHPAVNAFLGGWKISSIISAHTGFPITVTATDVSLQNPRGTARPNRIGDGVPDNQTIERWLDISDFVLPPSGSFGNSGVGVVRAPSYANWDFSIGKKFFLTEQKYLDFRTEFFNFTNHPSFSPPATSISAPNTFGTITNTVSSPRNLEFALKFYF
ncbi:MAG: TonB-dependent receptor [Pyrinomonadaceae bacterium]|nr:TonB-dependent receptor [Pyrinomonadaceae bacterium]